MRSSSSSPKVRSVPTERLVSFLDQELKVSQIKDSSCNGLQVQGSDCIDTIGLAVDASLATYHAAIDLGCQMVIVHHGLIWDSVKRITGPTYRQIKFLIDNGLNLYAAHLPLDLHPILGNNAQLADLIGLTRRQPFGLYHGVNIGFSGTLTRSQSIEQLCSILERKLGASCLTLPFGQKLIKTVAIVSGGASGELTEAIDTGIDCYITGEPAHHNHHAALEAAINVIYAGHYHSEKPGVKAVGKALEKKFGVRTEFLDVPTIV